MDVGKVIENQTFVKKDSTRFNMFNVLFNLIHNNNENIANMICLIAKLYLCRVRDAKESINMY